ncbi:MAG: response regulator [Fibrobacter sp.]|nr:response regulator [Fibrobacter sp.]
MKRTVLVIDDSREFLKSMKLLLESSQYQVLCAEDGESGFNAAVSWKPGLIILDVMMEDSDTGLNILRRLRDDANTEKVPVFLVTGIKKPEYLLQSFAPGESFNNVKEVFEKPVDPELFEKAIASI